MQKRQQFCIFIHFRYFTLFNVISVNILTIALCFVRFTYTFQSWYLSVEKPLVSGPKTLGFASWNPWFYNLKPRLSDRKSMGISNHSPRTLKLYIYAILAACRQTATSQPSKYKKNNKETTINNIYMAYQTLYLNCCLWLSLCCFMLFFVVLCCFML